MEEIDGGVLGGHFGVERTLDAVGWHYWWDGMRKDVEEIIRGCPECNARGSDRRKREGHCSNLLNELVFLGNELELILLT